MKNLLNYLFLGYYEYQKILKFIIYFLFVKIYQYFIEKKSFGKIFHKKKCKWKTQT